MPSVFGRKSSRRKGKEGEEGGGREGSAEELQACTPSQSHPDKKVRVESNQRVGRRKRMNYGSSGIKQPGCWKRRSH